MNEKKLETRLGGSGSGTHEQVSNCLQTRMQTWMISKWRFFITACNVKRERNVISNV